MSSVIYPNGTVTVTVPYGEKIAISCKDGEAVVFYSTFPANTPETFYEESRVTNSETVLGAFASDVHIKIDAGLEKVYYQIGADPAIVADTKVTRSTIANAATVTSAEHQGLCLYQDASAGAVTMTTLTGTQLAAAFEDIAIGESIPQYHASNHATNTSTLSGGVDVTLVGSGAVTQTGGQYLLIKTAATTFDLVRVG
jgi:hypothetical protein